MLGNQYICYIDILSLQSTWPTYDLYRVSWPNPVEFKIEVDLSLGGFKLKVL